METSKIIKGPFADLTNDVAFKWVFGQESNRDILKALLNELLPDKTISDITLFKENNLGHKKGLKNGVFDISCKTDDGAYIDVEIQVRPQKWFADRCLYYSTYCIQEQVKTGQESYLLKPVYIVSIDAFTLSHRTGWDGSIQSSYSLREDRTHELMTDSLHFVFVELEHFDKSWEDIDNDKERFYFCIRHLHELDNLPEGFTEGIWAKLAQQSELAEMPSELKNKYIRNMTTEIDKRAQLKYAERKGHEAGLAEGMEKGLEAGRAEGLEKALTEKLEAARKMMADGLSIETICKYTGLAPEQITD